MTCMNGFDNEKTNSTFLQLGGVDGSLCLRELSKREKDGKLQCVLLKCFQSLKPGKNDEELVLAATQAEGCPVTSLSTTNDGLCVVGDAGCFVFVVKLDAKTEVTVIERSISSTSTAKRRGSTESINESLDCVSMQQPDNTPIDQEEVQRQVTSIRRSSNEELPDSQNIREPDESPPADSQNIDESPVPQTAHVEHEFEDTVDVHPTADETKNVTDSPVLANDNDVSPVLANDNDASPVLANDDVSPDNQTKPSSREIVQDDSNVELY